MYSKTASKRYAKALIESALEKNLLEETYSEINSLNDILNNSSELSEYLLNPTISKDDKYFKLNLGLSNICNLGCVMCVPSNSSFFWEEKTKYDPYHFFDRSSYDSNAPKTPIKQKLKRRFYQNPSIIFAKFSNTFS